MEEYSLGFYQQRQSHSNIYYISLRATVYIWPATTVKMTGYSKFKNNNNNNNNNDKNNFLFYDHLLLLVKPASSKVNDSPVLGERKGFGERE